MRLHQLRRRVQHVELNAHADFVAELRGFELRARGHLGRFERADLCQSEVDAGIGVARGVGRRAARRFEIEVGAFLQCERFAHATLNQSAGVDRHIQQHTHRAAVDARIQVAALRAVEFVDVVAADQIDSRLVGVTLPLDLACCDFVTAACDLHGVAAGFGCAHPGVDVLRQRRVQIRPLAQWRQRIGFARNDDLQLAAANQ